MSSVEEPAPLMTDPMIAGPAEPSERIAALDVLRGFAVLGILLVNMVMFAWPHELIATDAPWTALHDRISWFFISVFATGKFYAIFSFLFGVGLSIQLGRAAARGQGSVIPFIRRMLVLLMVGVAHIVLLWSGDILHLYAIFGLLLLAFRGTRNATAVGCGGVLLAIPLAMGLLLALVLVGFGEMVAAEAAKGAIERQERIEQLMTAYSTGSFGEITRARISEWFVGAGKGVVFYPLLMGLFLFGFAAGRSGWIVHLLTRDSEAGARTTSLPEEEFPALHLGTVEPPPVAPPQRIAPGLLLRRMMTIGFVAGIPLAITTALLEQRVMADETSLLVAPLMFTYVIGNLLLASAYFALIATLCRRGIGPLLGRFGTVGRMALTNYLMHSVICTTIFYSYGLALYGRIGPAAGLLITAAIFVLQLIISPWWLSRFRFGPVEWFWRAATYLRRP